ncbi:MAG: hypothetical protein L6Q77_12515 [Bacteroidetes bacterium]|nr:hypothetical protein [Bacteroidota bacterium]
MKSKLTLSPLTLLILLTACDKESVIYEDKANEKYAIFAERTDSVYNSDKRKWVTGDLLDVLGSLYADPIPENLAVKLNGTVAFNSVDLDGFLLSQGGSGFFENTYLAYQGGPVHLEILTNHGKTTCTLAMPPLVTGLKITPAGKTLGPDEPLVVSWDKPDCDAVRVILEWEKRGSNGHVLSSSQVDTILAGNSVSFPHSCFKSGGTITVLEVSGLNGKVPRLTYSGNLEGPGKGQFACTGKKVKLYPLITISN